MVPTTAFRVPQVELGCIFRVTADVSELKNAL
ncbi:hypothetical protein LCGC14_0435460 [marine sediment metagenome]|uniref:Uncharacterized protein n=1 Tax=marine sediment metagenome TaxID=412755 RepID=A0A0F9V8X1_9ZZZZ